MAQPNAKLHKPFKLGDLASALAVALGEGDEMAKPI